LIISGAIHTTVADHLQPEADQHEPDHLPDLVVRQDGEEVAVDPVALRVLGQHGVDQDGERPSLEQPTVTETAIRQTSAVIQGQSGVKYAIARR
jgi:hypothetical protein